MDDRQLLERINSFERWHYQFDLAGHLTPIANKTRINRHRQRKRYFFDPLVALCGGSLEGLRVLDLGCNAGFWSLHAIENGCDYVAGVDGREMHIDQANLVFETKGVSKARYDFVQGDIFDYDLTQLGRFDIVFFFGLMYHISKPIVLMEKIAEVNSDIVVIDTGLSTVKGSYLQVSHEGTDDPRNAVSDTLILLPTKKAVAEIAQRSGYSVVMLRPQFTDYTGAATFNNNARKAFICAKKTDLSTLDGIAEPIDDPPPSRVERLLRYAYRKFV